MTLTGDSTFRGLTTVAEGTLRIGEGGTSGSIVSDIANNGVVRFSRSDALSYSGNISGSGSLVKDGEGVLTLTGANTYGGGTLVNKGALSIASDGNIGRGLNVLDGGTLLLTGKAYSKDWSLFRPYEGGTNAIDTPADVTHSGVFNGAGGFAKLGAGVLTLTGENTYTGGTTISEGTLRIGNDGRTGSIRGDIRNNAVLEFDRSDSVTYGGVISGTGSLVKSGAGVLALTAESTYEGGTTIRRGALSVGNGGTTGAVPGDIVNNARLIFDRSDSFVHAGNISGSGTMLKLGQGVLTLTGDSTYRGLTTVREGTLRIGDGGASGSIVSDIANNGVVTFNRSDALEYGGIISGPGSLVKDGDGTLTLTGANTYTGATEILAGTLSLAGGRISDDLTLRRGTVMDTGGASVRLSRLNVPGPANWRGDLDASGGTMRFFLPETMTAAAMLTVTGTADISGSLVEVGIDGSSSSLRPGDSVCLVDAGSLTGRTGNSKTPAWALQGVTLLYTFDLETRGNRLMATLSGVGPKVDTRTTALAEGFLGGLALANQGGELAASQGVAQAVRASGGVDRAAPAGFGAFSAVSGGSMRFNTGSHIDMASVSILAGLAAGANLDPGRLTLGAFFEYGNGSYDTHNSFANAASAKGDGHARYTGGGILARMDFNEAGPGRFYAEASGRAGGVHNDYRNNDLRDSGGRKADFSTSSPYYGLHAGLGYIWQATEASSLDLYGKYLWTRQEGESVRLSTDDPVTFKSADSKRTRLGARFTHAANQYVSPYLGGAYEREFDGKVRSTAYGYSLDSPSLGKDTGIGEIGLTVTPSRNLPLSMDLAVQGYLGAREGVTGSLQLKYAF